MKNPLKFTVEEQLLMGLINLGGLIVMLIATAVYLIGWGGFSTIFDWMIGINAFFGVGFLGSTFIGMLQQYALAKLANPVQDMVKGINDLFSTDVKGGDTDGEEK